DGFEQERHQHRKARKPQSLQRADLARTLTHRGIHGDGCADHGANRKEQRDQDADSRDEDAGPLRLLLVILAFAIGLQPELLVMLHGSAERVELRGGLQLNQNRAHQTLAPEGAAQRVDVAPDLRIESAAPGVEDTHDLHRSILLQLETLTELETLIAPAQRLADHDLVGARLCGAAGDDVELTAQLVAHRFDST